MKAVFGTERWVVDTALITFMDISERILVRVQTGNTPKINQDLAG